MSQAAAQRSFLQQLLNAVERTGNKAPHPAIIFLSMSAIVIVLSHLFFIIVAMGVLSSVASDAGYLVLIPVGAAAFLSIWTPSDRWLGGGLLWRRRCIRCQFDDRTR